MTEKSRTEYSARNTTVAMAARMIAILAGFLTRVVFTHTLSEEYVGINGLFTDILNVLALSELGVGTAITYALYKPISEKDVEKQKSLMRMYRQFYRIVAVIVLVGGLLVIPFMDILIKNQPRVEHLIFIYLMYLLNSVLSYLLIYKRTLIDAHQLSYIGVLYQTIFLIVQNLAQMTVLLVTGNFILYVSILILCTIANNFCISRKADKMYPYLKEKEAERLPGQERQEIYQNIRAMLMHKVGTVIVNNTDNLLLSSMVGIVSVSRYSNYFLIIGSVRQVLNQMFQGITASVGNLGVEESRERVKKIFEASFFIGQWMFGLAAICLYELIDPFVEISFGAQYVFTRDVTLILCLNFYLTGMRQATLVFRDSMGLFWYDRYKSLAEAAINLVVSIILGKYLGTAGIFLGTMVSTVTTSLWVEPYMLYKHRLEVSSKPYFLRYVLYAAVTFVLWMGEDALCGHITGNLWLVCIFRLLICFIITNLVYLILYHRTKEFRLLMRKAWEILCKRRMFSAAAGKEDGDRKAFCREENMLIRLLNLGLNSRTETEEIYDGKAAGRPEIAGRTVRSAAIAEDMAALPGDKNDVNDGDVTAADTKENVPDWDRFLSIADGHGVLSLLYDVIMEEKVPQFPQKVRKAVSDAAIKTTMQSYRLLFLCKYLIGRMEGEGIPVVLLKGVGTASFYPVPELRKSGDVDLLLLDLDRLQEACLVLEKSGCRVKEKQPSLHHVVYISDGGIEIELHTMLAEPFDNKKMNKYLQGKLSDCKRHVVRTDIMGVELPILTPGYHAYELLLHMLQHFLRSGFGLKLLCDWVVLWNHGMEKEEKLQYLDLVEESGLKGFSDMVTLACCEYLGLCHEKVRWMELPEGDGADEFMAEVLEAEEFGKSASDRMVVLRNVGISDYVREFHHQMCLNFPGASRYILLWPGLWVITLIRFLYNNRKIRKVSGSSILKKAGQRSRLIARMGLWK